MGVLGFERRVVRAFTTARGESERAAIEDYIDRSLRSMPEHLRAGVLAGSLALGTWAALERTVRRLDDEALDKRIEAWEGSPIGPVHQYIRLMRSQVLFAEQELASPSANGDA